MSSEVFLFGGFFMSKKINTMVKIGILVAISVILMTFLEFPVPFFPEWLKIDLSDIPAMLGAFALGPVEAVIIELLKNILHIAVKGTTSGGVGELANFIIGASLVMPAAIVYMKNKTKNSALIGLIIGIILMTVIGSIANYYILIPIFAKIMPLKQIFSIAAIVNPKIKDTTTYIVYAVIPFNLIKGIVEAFITFILYKRLSGVLHR